MYEKWIEDDSEDLKLTKEQIKELQSKLDAVKVWSRFARLRPKRHPAHAFCWHGLQSSQSNHENALAEKELILAGKEDVLSVHRVWPFFGGGGQSLPWLCLPVAATLMLLRGWACLGFAHAAAGDEQPDQGHEAAAQGAQRHPSGDGARDARRR
jgi:hypothetical protein